MIKKRKRPRGRPSQGDDTLEQISIRFPRPMLAAVDEILAGRLDRPDRSQIIRELIAEGLEARKLKGGRK